VFDTNGQKNGLERGGEEGTRKLETRKVKKQRQDKQVTPLTNHLDREKKNCGLKTKTVNRSL